MSGINLKSQNGNMTTTVVGVIMMLATLGVILATLSSSDSTLQLFQQEEQRAFYAAQSGLEYGLKRYLASDKVTEFTLNDMNIGSGVKADISLTKKNGQVIITSTGKAQKAVKKVQTVISGADSNYIPDYAVFSDSPVSNVVTLDSLNGNQNSALLYQNAPTLPKFDLTNLKTLSKKVQKDGNSYYYDGDLTVDESFKPPANTIVYVEGKITFKKGNWDGPVYFVSNGDAAFADSWKNSDDDVKMVLYLPDSRTKVKLLPVNSDDDPVEFKVENGKVIPKEEYAASVTVIGGDLPFGYWIFWPIWLETYDAPITVKVKVGEGESIYPFGPSPGSGDHELKTKVDAGNVNDDHNPRTYVLPKDYSAGTAISVTATSWSWSRPWGKDYQENLKANSIDDQDIVLALRDGDPVPNIPAFGNQLSAAEFIKDYINFNTQRISLEDNQVIYLFELASRDLTLSTADFQDLVLMVTLAREKDDLASVSEEKDDDDEEEDHEKGDDKGDDKGDKKEDEDEHEDDEKSITNYLTFTGGIISEGAVFGMQTAKKEEKKITNKLRVIRDKDMIKSFLAHSINGNARIILSSKWKSMN